MTAASEREDGLRRYIKFLEEGAARDCRIICALMAQFGVRVATISMADVGGSRPVAFYAYNRPDGSCLVAVQPPEVAAAVIERTGETMQ